MVADEVDYVVGVDTHRDEHVLAVVCAPAGAVVAQRQVPASGGGYAQALRFADQHAAGTRVWAIEGAGHYGAGLARFLSGRGEAVVEAGRALRQQRRLRGKDDDLDAIAARGVQKLCRALWSLLRALAASVGCLSSSEVVCAVVIGLPGAVPPVRPSGSALPFGALEGHRDPRAPA